MASADYDRAMAIFRKWRETRRFYGLPSERRRMIGDNNICVVIPHPQRPLLAMTMSDLDSFHMGARMILSRSRMGCCERAGPGNLHRTISGVSA